VIAALSSDDCDGQRALSEVPTTATTLSPPAPSSLSASRAPQCGERAPPISGLVGSPKDDFRF
jgi:hypothetical protein